MNIFGQKILEKGIENYSMGEHLVSIDTKNIAPGMYFLKVADDETNFLKPLIILAQ